MNAASQWGGGGALRKNNLRKRLNGVNIAVATRANGENWLNMEINWRDVWRASLRSDGPDRCHRESASLFTELCGGVNQLKDVTA